MKLIQIKGIDIRRIRVGPPKISAQQLANKIGVSRKTIVNWENDVGCPTILDFAKICFYCKISMGRYLQAAEDREEDNQPINLDRARCSDD